ncbi:phytoene dehydrogenase [Chytriomyces sp. MP71]|nr:phytoene dehydrogenase [Chytriomyces sp. MP71]
MPADRNLRVVVVGAGTGGTATAARLSQLGMDVLVLEKNEFCGGRCSLIETKSGFRFDQGPSMLLMPHVFAETYADLGVRMKDVVDLVKCKTNYKVNFPDGDSVTLSTDMTTMKNELERLEPGSFDGYLRFLREAKHHHDTSFSMVLTKNYAHWWDLVTIQNAIEAIKLHVLTTLWGRVCKFFKSDKLRRAFTFQSMYMGMSPFDAPGTYSLLDYSEATDGILYPMGGFNKIMTTLETIAKSRGAEFRYSCPVTRIDVDPVTKLASGVTLESGEKITADLVICNMDLVTAYSRLLPQTRLTHSILRKNQSCSTISFYWGLNRKLPEDSFHAHNIFLAQDYKPSFDTIFKEGTLPDNPSFYVHVPTRVDPAAAPDGCDAVMILVPTACLGDDATSRAGMKALVARARAAVVAGIQSRLTDEEIFEDWIVSEEVNSPLDWEDKFGLWKGSALGLSHEVLQVLYFRPQMRHEKYGNVFFVGASTHPGTGVPVVLCGAKVLEKIIVDIVKAGKGFKRELYFGILGYEKAVTLSMIIAIVSVIVGFISLALGEPVASQNA